MFGISIAPSGTRPMGAARWSLPKGALMSSSNEMVSVAQIEAAINIWRNRKPAAAPDEDGAALCFEARKLADVYGVMIVTRQYEVELSSLSEAQRAALAGVFA
jgi:hypothetical protein